MPVLILAGILPNCGRPMERQSIQFDPLPIVDIGARELAPVQPRTVTELLRAANSAFADANSAQERGEGEAALRYYTLMLELLLEADLDPSIFYDLRGEFTSILDSSTRLARSFERRSPTPLTADALELAARSGLEYPYPLPERVLVELEQIQELYPENYEAGMSRSSRYLDYIRGEFAKAGLPGDLVWLAMVESQFTPKIVSRAGAGGMWQFMRSTGRNYGLRVDWYVDERYEWKKATRAAIAYLSDLYEMFDQNWPIAVSAYNMGERGMSRAIAANGGELNLWNLIETPPAANRIRRETKKFYPKLLASAIVAKHPNRYDVYPKYEAADSAAYATVKGSFALRDLDRELGLPEGTLQKYNPHLIRGVTPPGKEYEIFVPPGLRTKVAAASRRIPKQQGIIHVVQRNATPGGIAQRYNVTAVELMRTNNISSPRRLQIGQRLLIPGRGGDAAETAAASSPATGKTYRVRRGDSLSKIATRFGLRISELQALNDMGRRTQIHAGQVLVTRRESTPEVQTAKAPIESPVAPTPGGAPVEHRVVAREFAAKIADRYGVALADLLSWNGLMESSTIRVGQILKIYPSSSTGDVPAPARTQSNTTFVVATTEDVPAPARTQTAETPEGTVKFSHRVASGDNASVIASKFSVRTRDFLAWNGLTARSVLHVGDEYTLYLPEERVNEFKRLAKAQTGSAESRGRKTTHVVKSGQNPSTIAKRYRVQLSDLFLWNGWTTAPVLQVGAEIIVYTR